MQIIPEVKMLYNPQSKSTYNFVPGVMGMVLILICAMMTSIAIVREKEMGTMEILLSSLSGTETTNSKFRIQNFFVSLSFET